MNRSIKALSAGALMSFSAAAFSLPITGEIGFSSTFGTDTGNLATATFIDVSGDDADVGFATGSLAPLDGTEVTYSDFYIDGTGLPYAPLWSGGGFYFNLLSMNITNQEASNISLTGTGILGGVGFDDTEYHWSWSGDNSTGSFNFFSSTNTPVPEPGTLALLGLGLAGLGAARRRQKA